MSVEFPSLKALENGFKAQTSQRLEDMDEQHFSFPHDGVAQVQFIKGGKVVYQADTSWPGESGTK